MDHAHPLLIMANTAQYRRAQILRRANQPGPDMGGVVIKCSYNFERPQISGAGPLNSGGNQGGPEWRRAVVLDAGGLFSKWWCININVDRDGPQCRWKYRPRFGEDRRRCDCILVDLDEGFARPAWDLRRCGRRDRCQSGKNQPGCEGTRIVGGRPRCGWAIGVGGKLYQGDGGSLSIWGISVFIEIWIVVDVGKQCGRGTSYRLDQY